MYKNLSDGKSNGIVLFYMKDGKLKPTGLTQSQANMLDLVLAVPFKDEKLYVQLTHNINVKEGVSQESTLNK